MPHEATFVFRGSLNDFLPEANRQQAQCYRFQGKPSLKDAIEAQGVPHPEVGLVLLNGQEQPLSCHLLSGDYAEVHPRALPEFNAAQPPRFLLDVHLGKLARLLRMLGFDTVYQATFRERELVEISQAENRLLLTRDLELLKHKAVQHGYRVRSEQPDEQVAEIVRHFRLQPLFQPFSRCLRCNGALQEISKAAVTELLEPKTKAYFETFFQCSQCCKIYWQGSHFDRMRQYIAQLERLT